jgi:hypothetical protein
MNSQGDFEEKGKEEGGEKEGNEGKLDSRQVVQVV